MASITSHIRVHTLHMTLLLRGFCFTVTFEKQKKLEGVSHCFSLFLLDSQLRARFLTLKLELSSGWARALPMGQHLAHLERDSLEHWPYWKTRDAGAGFAGGTVNDADAEAGGD